MKTQLSTENVEYLIVHASNTKSRQGITPKQLTAHRKQAGYPDIGFHYVITRDGHTHLGVVSTTAGTHTPRFDSISLGVLLIGGHSTRGRPSNNYTVEQKDSLRLLLDHLTTKYPRATLCSVGDLVGGTNPHFNVQDFYYDPSRRNQ